jgi:hypothetical protein
MPGKRQGKHDESYHRKVNKNMIRYCKLFCKSLKEKVLEKAEHMFYNMVNTGIYAERRSRHAQKG